MTKRRGDPGPALQQRPADEPARPGRARKEAGGSKTGARAAEGSAQAFSLLTSDPTDRLVHDLAGAMPLRYAADRGQPDAIGALAAALRARLLGSTDTLGTQDRDALRALVDALQALDVEGTAPSALPSVLDLVDHPAEPRPFPPGETVSFTPSPPLDPADLRTLSVNEVAERLGLTRQAVHNRRRDGLLIAWPGARGDRYPAWQFVGTEVLPGLEAFLMALPPEARSAAGDLLVTQQPELGTTPLAALRAGRVAAVVQFAERFGEHGAA